MHQEIVVLRQVLKTGAPAGLSHEPARSVAALPEQQQNFAPRVVFARRIQAALRGDARTRGEPPQKKIQTDYEDLHDYVLFMVNTGLRPDESQRIEFATSKSSMTSTAAKQSSKSMCAASAASAFAKACRARCIRFKRVVEAARTPQPTNRVPARRT